MITADSITDEQIRELRLSDEIEQAIYVEAIWGVDLKRPARAHCAALLNARAKEADRG